MKRIYRSLSIMLAAILLFGVIPVSASESASEIWPGYPGLDQLPAVDTIPDLFKFFDVNNDPTGDGYVSTTEEWNERRNEIKELVQHYWLGYRWPTEAKDVSGSTVGKTNTVTITNPDSGVSGSFTFTLTMPTVAQIQAVWGDANAQVPVIIDIGGALGANTSVMNAQGYAHINFTPTAIYPDSQSATPNRNGLYTKLYPYNKDVYEYASGALMAWGWGVSQIINALEQPVTNGDKTWGQQLQVDPTKTLVTGHSRYGKAAMFAAAFDDRISICLPSESGGSGIQSFRYKVEGKIFNFNTYPKADRVYGKTEIPTVSYGGGNSWFPETAAQFVKKDNQLPFDSSDIISLIAPRPFLATTGIDAHWLGNEGGVAAVQAASEVYAYIGNDEIEKSNIAVRARESNHVLYKRDLPFVIAIMDREFKQTDDKKLHVLDLFPTGTGLGNMSYPAQDFNKVSEFNSFPFELNSSYLPWSSPDKYTLWTAQENFLVGYSVTITAHSNAPNVKLYLPDNTEINAASHNGEVFNFNLTAEQAVYGRYKLKTSGEEKSDREVYFAAVSLADSLRHATSKGDEGEENRLIGFSSRLANNAANPPEVYVDGKRVSMSFSPERVKPEETTLLEYGILFHDPLFVRIANAGWNANKTFDIKNLDFVTIPGFTFEISFGNITASAANAGKTGAANFTQPISWNVEKFNNGPANVWPVAPDTPAERAILADGGTITRPDAPAPKATNFKTQIVGTKAEHVGNKTNVIIDFDTALDTREFGFGVDVTNNWDTIWSNDSKQVTLSFDYDKFPEGSDANIIIFRLMDTGRNMIPGPIYLPVSLPGTPGSTLAGPNAVIPGQMFDVTYGLSGVDTNVFAQDLTITYDNDQLELAAPPASMDEGKFVIVDYKADTPGTIRILGVHLGDRQSDSNAELIKLSFRAKGNAHAGLTNVEVTKLVVADGDGTETVQPGAVHSIQINVIDKVVLNALISEAQSANDQAIEGKQIGQYPAGSKSILQEAINLAREVSNNPTASQAQIDASASQLNDALLAFRDSVIVKIPGDYNGNGKNSIGDLAMMAKAYGMTTDDAGWDLVKQFDLNNDGFIDILDLAIMARMIFDW